MKAQIRILATPETKEMTDAAYNTFCLNRYNILTQRVYAASLIPVKKKIQKDNNVRHKKYKAFRK